MEALEARQLLAAVAWDGGGDGTSWHDPLNWDTDVVPTAADDVTIDVAGNPTVVFNATTGSRAVNSLVTRELMTFSGGALAVGTTATIDGVTVTLGGAIWSGGTWGTANGGQVQVTGGLLSGVTLNADATIGNARTLSVTNGLTLHGTITLANTGISANLNFSQGTQALVGTGQVVLAGTSNNNYVRLGIGGATSLTVGPGITIRGRGMIEQSVASTLVNQGTIEAGVSEQSLGVLVSNFTNNGTVQATTGATLTINNVFTNLSAGTLTGGVYRVVGASTLSFPGPVTTNAAAILLDGPGSSIPQLGGLATNAAAGTLELANGRAFTFTPAGDLFTNAGTLIKSGTGTATIAATITLNNTGTLDSRGGTFVVGGPVSQVVGGALSGGTWLVAAGAVLDLSGANITTNNSTITLGGTASFLGLQGLATNNGWLTLENGYAWGFTPAGGVFFNPGEMVIAGGTVTVPSGVAFNNSGNPVHVQPGAGLRLQGGGASSGDFEVLAGASIEFAGGNFTFTADSLFYGGGNVTFSAGTNSVAGPIQTTGALTISGGSTTFTGAVGNTDGVGPGTPIVILGGAAAFNGPVGNDLTPGPLVVAPGSSASFGGTATVSVAALAGTLTVTGGSFTVRTDIDNAGLFVRQGGSVSLQAAPGQTGSHTGDFQIMGGRIDFYGDHTFAPTSDLTGTGGVGFGISTAAVAGVVNLTGTSLFAASSADGPTDVTFSGPSVVLGTVITSSLVPVAVAGSIIRFATPATVASVQQFPIGGGDEYTTRLIAQATATVTVTGAVARFGGGAFTGRFEASGGTFNLNGGGTYDATVFDLTAGGQVNLAGTHAMRGGTGGTGVGRITNTGTILHDTPDVSEFGPGVQFNNPGMLNVTSGRVRILGAIDQFSGGTLNAGTWCGTDPGQIDLGNTVILTNGPGSTIMLTGPGAAFDNINGMTANQGWFTIRNGRNFAAAAFDNPGTLVVGQSSTFSTVGPASNSGLVTVNAGTFSATGGSAGAGHTGDFMLIGGALLVFGGNHTFTSTSDITGNGSITFLGGTSTLGGTINITGTINFQGNNETLNGPVTAGGALISAASVVAFNAATTLGTLSLAGTLTGAGVVGVSGVFTWADGLLAGTAPMNLPAGSSLVMSANGTRTLGRALNLAGAATYSNGSLTLTGGEGGGAITVLSGGVFTADGADGISGSGPGTASFTNHGSFVKTAANNFYFAVAFVNHGSVSLDGHALSAGLGGLHTGDVLLSGGAVLSLTGQHSFAPTADFIGNGGLYLTLSAPVTIAGVINVTGTVLFQSTTFVVDGPLSCGALSVSGSTTIVTLNGPAATTGSLQLQGATIEGSGDLTVTGAVTWNGGTMGGTGRTIIAPTGTVSVSGGVGLARTLRNAGSATVTGAVYANGGTFDNLAGATLTVAGGALVHAGGSNALLNAGTLVGSAFGAWISVPLVNTGSISILAGVFHIGGGGSTTTTLVVPAGATLELAGVFVHAPGTAINAAGAVEFVGGTHAFSSALVCTGTLTTSGGSILTFAPGTFQVSGTVNFTTGTVTVPDAFAPAALGWIGADVTLGDSIVYTGPVEIGIGGRVSFGGPQTFSALSLSGTAELAGAGDVTITGLLTWYGGNAGGMTGTGRTILAPGASMSGSGPMVLGRTLSNSGSMTFGPGSTLRLDDGAVLDNLEGGTITFSGAGNLIFGGGVSALSNAGALVKAGAGTLYVGVPMGNGGSVAVQGGWLVLNGGLPQLSGTTLTGGAWSVSGDSMLSIPGGSIVVSSATIALSGPDSAFPALDALAVNNGSLALDGGRVLSLASLTNYGTISVGSGSTLAVTGTLLLASGTGTFDAPPVAAVLEIAPAAAAVFNADAAGSIGTIINAGSLTVGPHALTITGDFVQTAGAVLRTTLASAGVYGRVAAAGSITLGGDLHALPAVGFSPVRGDRFDLVVGSTRTGTFAAVQTPAAPQAARWVTLSLPAAVQLLFTSAADWNADGALTPADVASFVTDWSASLAGGTLVGDFNGDGTVSPSDVAVFVSTWFAAL